MDLKEIKRIIDMVETANITSLSIENEGSKIEIKKEFFSQQPVQVSLPHPAQLHDTHNLHIASGHQIPAVDTKPTEVKRDASLIAITSPMVGTFYASSSPDSPAYTKVGDRINLNQVVCIIEAMKIFNEIESEISGIVEQICVENGTPVEYGQELFLVRPA